MVGHEPRRAVHACVPTAATLRNWLPYVHKEIVANKEVVPCMVDGNKDASASPQGEIAAVSKQASLKLQEYNPKRDFVAAGGDGDSDIPEFKKLSRSDRREHSGPGNTFCRRSPGAKGERLARSPTYDDSKWPSARARAPNRLWRKTSSSQTQGNDRQAKKGSGRLVFRRSSTIAEEDLLDQKGVVFKLNVASALTAADRVHQWPTCRSRSQGTRSRVRLLESFGRHSAQTGEAGPATLSARPGPQSPSGSSRHHPRYGVHLR